MSREEGVIAGLRLAAGCVEDMIVVPIDCEALGVMDEKTGVRPCMLDRPGDVCLCAFRNRALSEALAQIRAQEADHDR